MGMPQQKPGKSKQDYTTPPEFLQAVRNRLKIQQFAIDLAARKENAVCERYYSIEEGHSSFLKVWNYDGWCWLNPPYADIHPWVQKAAIEAEHGAHVCVLVPASVGTDWWQEWVNPYAYVSFLKGRLSFGGTLPNPKTGKHDPYPKDCALLLYTPWQFAGNEIWDWQNSVPTTDGTVPELRGEPATSEGEGLHTVFEVPLETGL